MPVPRIPTAGRCLAALPAAVPLPPRMRLALRRREPGSAGGGRRRGGGRTGTGRLAPSPASPAGSPRPPPPSFRPGSRGNHLQRGAAAAGAEPAPCPRGKTLTSAAIGPRGPQERAGSGALFSPAPLARPALKASPSGCAHTRSEAPPRSPKAPPLALGEGAPSSVNPGPLPGTAPELPLARRTRP